jgi:hypothetical protein
MLKILLLPLFLLSLNFRYIYRISWFALFYLLLTMYSLHNYIYILWPEDGPVLRPKHVVSLTKDNNIRYLCFDSTEPLFNYSGTFNTICNGERVQLDVEIQTLLTENRVRLLKIQSLNYKIWRSVFYVNISTFPAILGHLLLILW